MLNNLDKKQKYTILILLSILAIVIGISYIVVINSQEKNTKNDIDNNSEIKKEVSISLNGDSILSKNNKNTFKLKLKMSQIPSNIYSSASFSISFDKNKVEFVDIEKGDILTYSSNSPSWEYDVKASNKRGQVNIIYLDSTGGKESFTSKSIVEESKNNILILEFKLKDDVESGENISFKIKDAVFATVNGDKDNSSLSTKNKNIKFEDCNIKIE
ncbi:MAG: cohesin domain-containing protein [Terrisporobacter othiniensis]|nr:cohesin domain-containing protein [Terrisporobacter othiniensis]MDU6993774.1 cohesin domain-containing protein [Terrisporobacter othiniensis]